MKKLIYPFLFVCIFFASCASHKKYTFAPMDSLQSLSGIYINDKDYIAKAFNQQRDSTDAYKFDFTSDKTLDLYRLTDNGFKFVETYKGKWKKKDNYFQITLTKKIIPLIVINRIENDRVKIGRDSVGRLFISKEEDYFGSLLILIGDGPGYFDFAHSFNSVSDDMLLPVKKDDKWGFTDSKGNMLIEPLWDFVRFFEGDAARVLSGSKWGLINKSGEVISPIKYDKIESFGDDDYTRVFMDGKRGLLGKNGNEILPPIYDEISHLDGKEKIGTHRIGYKYGITSSKGEIYPPMFDWVNVSDFTSIDGKIDTPYCASVRIGKKHYLADKKGFLHSLKAPNQPFAEAVPDGTPKIWYKDITSDAIQSSIHTQE